MLIGRGDNMEVAAPFTGGSINYYKSDICQNPPPAPLHNIKRGEYEIRMFHTRRKVVRFMCDVVSTRGSCKGGIQTTRGAYQQVKLSSLIYKPLPIFVEKYNCLNKILVLSSRLLHIGISKFLKELVFPWKIIQILQTTHSHGHAVFANFAQNIQCEYKKYIKKVNIFQNLQFSLRNVNILWHVVSQLFHEMATLPCSRSPR